MIPVQNIYYLLSYAWNKLTESETLSTGLGDYNSLINLFTRVLINGSTQLVKRGLHADYRVATEAYRGIKGKFLISDSIKLNHLKNGKAICEFDEFVVDTLPNQLIKATLYKLLRINEVEAQQKKQVRELLYKFHQVSLIEVKAVDFKRVRLNRNNYHYQFILKICQLILNNLTLNESNGQFIFRDFLRDKQMAYLFENFLLNFYQKHANFKKVKRELIHWNALSIGEGSVALPSMHTDISLIDDNRKIIIDAKYYKEALQTHYNKESIRSGNLYQLYAYLKNEKSANTYSTEGILIYPTVSKELDEDYVIDGHKVKIATINLNQDWQDIESDLLEIIEEPKP